MSIRATLLMSAGKYTWSESHYWIGGTTLQGSYNAGAALGSARAALLGQNARLDNVRMSEDGATRRVQYLDPALFDHVSRLPPDMGDDVYTSDRPNSSVLVRFLSPVGYKLLYLAGIPDGMVVTDPLFPKGIKILPQWAAVWNTYKGLLAGTWGYRAKQNGPAGIVKFVITNSMYPGKVGVQTDGLISLNSGDTVQLKGFRRENPRSKDLNGIWRVGQVTEPVSPSPTWTYFLERSSGVDPFNFYKLGTIAKLEYQIVPYGGALIERAVTRKRGGSFMLPRGRLRTKY